MDFKLGWKGQGSLRTELKILRNWKSKLIVHKEREIREISIYH